MGVGFEVGIDQVGQFAGAAVDLDVGAFDFALVGAGATFVDPRSDSKSHYFRKLD